MNSCINMVFKVIMHREGHNYRGLRIFLVGLLYSSWVCEVAMLLTVIELKTGVHMHPPAYRPAITARISRENTRQLEEKERQLGTCKL